MLTYTWSKNANQKYNSLSIYEIYNIWTLILLSLKLLIIIHIIINKIKDKTNEHRTKQENNYINIINNVYLLNRKINEQLLLLLLTTTIIIIIMNIILNKIKK